MFRTVPLSIIGSFPLYTQQWCMSYRFADSLRAGSGSVPSWSCSQVVNKPVWHTPLLCLQWKTPDDGQRNCPKHVEFYSKNKFEKLVRLVGFIIRINYIVFDMFRTWKCTSSGRLVHAVVRYLFHAEIILTPILLTLSIWWGPNNASKWQMGFNSAFERLKG